MSQDKYRPVPRRTMPAYPCGLKAGDRLQLRADLPIRDSKDRSTSKVWPQGSIWTVVFGIVSEPDVVWLHQPDGQLHSWDESVLEVFELLKSAPAVGSRVVIRSLPAWIDQLPAESRRLFQLCLGRPLKVAEIDVNGLVVLDASEFDAEIGGVLNDLRVEAELLQTV